MLNIQVGLKQHKFIETNVASLVAPKAAVKHELLFNNSASVYSTKVAIKLQLKFDQNHINHLQCILLDIVVLLKFDLDVHKLTIEEVSLLNKSSSLAAA